jgi:hypothetical protein
MGTDKTLREQMNKAIEQQRELEKFLLERKAGSLLAIRYPFEKYSLHVKFQKQNKKIVMVGLKISYDMLKKNKFLTAEKAYKELQKKKYWKPIRFKRSKNSMFIGNFEFN